MRVERVDQVVFEDVHEIDPRQLIELHLDRLVHVGEADRVRRVDLIGAVNVCVEAVHHHPGSASNFVDGLSARLDLTVPQARNAIHLGGMDAKEVDGVRVRGAVAEGDAQAVALVCVKRRSRNAAVVGPGGELDARSHLDLLVGGDQRPFAQDASVQQSARLAPIEVAGDLVGIEAVGAVIDVPAGAERGVAASVGAASGGLSCCLVFGGVPRVFMRHAAVEKRRSGGEDGAVPAGRRRRVRRPWAQSMACLTLYRVLY